MFGSKCFLNKWTKDILRPALSIFLINLGEWGNIYNEIYKAGDSIGKNITEYYKKNGGIITINVFCESNGIRSAMIPVVACSNIYIKK